MRDFALKLQCVSNRSGFVPSSGLEELEGAVLVSVPVSRHLLLLIKKLRQFQQLGT